MRGQPLHGQDIRRRGARTGDTEPRALLVPPDSQASRRGAGAWLLCLLCGRLHLGGLVTIPSPRPPVSRRQHPLPAQPHSRAPPRHLRGQTPSPLPAHSPAAAPAQFPASPSLRPESRAEGLLRTDLSLCLQGVQPQTPPSSPDSTPPPQSIPGRRQTDPEPAVNGPGALGLLGCGRSVEAWATRGPGERPAGPAAASLLCSPGVGRQPPGQLGQPPAHTLSSS